MNFKKYISRVCFFFFLAVFPHYSGAQIVYNATDTTSIPTVRLDAVEITSMRESGRLSRLPVSAGVIDHQLIAQQQIQTLKGAAGLVANMFMPDYGSRLTSPVYIRGVGSRINAPSVGLYVDNIPYFEKTLFAFDMFDAERIEVLRGPQGTLYGRNTMGGLINVFSRSPFSYKNSDLTLTAGNPGHIVAMLSHAIKLSPGAAVSVNAGLNRHEGFFRNEYLNQMADSHLSGGGRVRVAWQLSPSLLAELITHNEWLDQGGYPYAVYNTEMGTTGNVSYNAPSSYARKMSSNGLVFKYQIRNIELQSVSAFQYYDDKQSIDQDFSDLDVVFAVQDQMQRMFSQEFTARSSGQGNYQWVTGVFGFTQRLDHELGINFGPDAVAMRMVPAMLTRTQAAVTNTSGAAVFHQSRLQHLFFEGLSLTAGLRVDYETANLAHHAFIEANFPTPPPVTFDSDMSFFAWMPRLALTYRIAGESSLYASLSRGYKTGGFNTVFENDEDRSFDPEYSWNYEAGVKAGLGDGRATVQLSAFYIDWQNQQIYQMLPSGQGSMLKNAGVSVSKGFEVDAAALIAKNLTFKGSYGYTHATFVENSPNPNLDLAGNFIPYVPRHTIYAMLSYRVPLKDKYIHALRLDVSYQGIGRHYWNEQNTFAQDAYGILGSRLALDVGAFGVDVFANNLSGSTYHSFSFAALGNTYVQQGRPATFGINLRYAF